MNRTQRYLSLVLIGFLPSLSGCLEHFRLKADVDVETDVNAEEVDQQVDSEAKRVSDEEELPE